MAIPEKQIKQLLKKIADNHLEHEIHLQEVLDDEQKEKLPIETRRIWENTTDVLSFLRTTYMHARKAHGTDFWDVLRDTKDLNKLELDNDIIVKINEKSFDDFMNLDKAMDHLIELKANRKNNEDPLINTSPYVKDNPTMKDTFWVNYGKKPFDKEDVEYFKNKLEELQEKGIDIHEYEQGGLYWHYMRDNNIMNSDLAPIAILDKLNDPKEQEKLVSDEYRLDVSKDTLDHFLRHVEDLHKERGVQWADITDREGLGAWIKRFKMPATVNMQETEQGVLEFSQNLKNIDRDAIVNYDQTLFDDAVEFAKDPENQKTLKFITEKAEILSTSNSQAVLCDAYAAIKGLSDKDVNNINKFRHLLYEMKTNYSQSKAIKLGDDKTPTWIDEFEPGDNVTAKRINKREQDALDTCYDMLKNAMSAKSNSKEYKKIMKDVLEAKKILQDDKLEPAEMKEKYQKAVEGIIGDIGNYYAHKAVKGETPFSTEHKYKVLYRVEKLMKSRYDGLNPKPDAFELDFNTGGAFSINDDDIPEDVVGDEYAKQATQSKVKNLVAKKEKLIEGNKARRNSIANVRELKKSELAAENTIKRSNSVKSI